ncbi:MAG: Ig-like domain-containing protein [Isosphaeraceae bacterium]|nr:Ig-like domain-containing protein [Isosphaeraceae bacterium]
MTHSARPSSRAPRRTGRPLSLETLESRALLATGPFTPAAALAAPLLAAQSDTGISNSDGITQDNGSSSAPLTFAIPSVTAGQYYSLYDVTNPSSPVLLSGPVLMLLGNSVTVSGSTLADGTHQIAYTSASSPTGTQSAFSQAAAITVETSLHVVSISPSGNFLTGGLPNNQVVVTFSGGLAGLVPDKADGSGFASNPFAVMLVPSGPEGGGLYANGQSLWSAPYGVDGGDLPIPATLVYHQNANGTSTITLTPDLGLNTDIYLISISGSLVDLAGNSLTNAQGNTGQEYSSFDLHASAATSTPLSVAYVTSNNGATIINNNQIPQPDTIGIAFNEPLDTWTANTSTIRLLSKSGPNGVSQVAAAVAYNPSTWTAYLTPEALLTPGTVYYVEVDTSVSNDQALPASGGTLAQQFITSFTVNASGVAAGHSPLKVTATNPPNGTLSFSNLGYGAVTFSEPINLASLGRFSAMLVPHTGGVTTGGSGYADVPLNAKLAFNPNTNQLIIVPTTGVLPNNTIYLFALSGISATNGDTLGSSPVYSTFKMVYPVLDSVRASASSSAASPAVVVNASPAPSSAPIAAAAPPRPSVAPPAVRVLARPAQVIDPVAVDHLLTKIRFA